MRLLFFGSILLASPCWAQSSQVTLQYDDGTGVSGELVEFADGNFRIQASVGLISIPEEDVTCTGQACPAGTTPDVPTPTVTLTSLDGSTTIIGDVIDFVDGEYVISTLMGQLQIGASDVTCEGTGCIPVPEPVIQDVVLVNGDTEIEGELVRVEDGVYIIQSPQLGQVRIDATAFECRGEACP